MNYDDILTRIPENARQLPAITACLDADNNQLWLHTPTATVYHAERDDDGNWTLTSEPADTATEWIKDPISISLDTGDHEVADEYGDIELAALRAKAATRDTDQRQVAVTVDRLLCGRIDTLRAELARVRRLRARHIQGAWDTDRRGGAASAAQDLGVGRATISRLLKGLD